EHIAAKGVGAEEEPACDELGASGQEHGFLRLGKQVVVAVEALEEQAVGALLPAVQGEFLPAFRQAQEGGAEAWRLVLDLQHLPVGPGRGIGADETAEQRHEDGDAD
ncbi:hypothetical protein RZS08_02155, partial [Arthrospira platensis SPKY1]|nr:hypothetical protein [Arthrospira platensis SPKY1]